MVAVHSMRICHQTFIIHYSWAERMFVVLMNTWCSLEFLTLFTTKLRLKFSVINTIDVDVADAVAITTALWILYDIDTIKTSNELFVLFFFSLCYAVLCCVEVHFHLFWVIDKSLWLCNLHIYLIGARQLRLTRVEGQPCNFKLVSCSSNERNNKMHAFTHCVHKLELGWLIRRADICLIKIKLTANEHEEKHQWMRSRVVSVCACVCLFENQSLGAQHNMYRICMQSALNRNSN